MSQLRQKDNLKGLSSDIVNITNCQAYHVLVRVGNTRVIFLSELELLIVLFSFLFARVRNSNGAPDERRPLQHDVTSRYHVTSYSLWAALCLAVRDFQKALDFITIFELTTRPPW